MQNGAVFTKFFSLTCLADTGTMKTALLFLGLFATVVTTAQSPQAIEASLLKQFEQIEYWSDANKAIRNSHRDDSLEMANIRFRDLLLKYTSGNAQTIKADFPKLKAAGVNIATSEDGLLRIYSWNTETGGTTQYFDNVFQYRGAKGIVSRGNLNSDEVGTGTLFPRIISVVAENRIIYMVTEYQVTSPMVRYEGVKGFAIDNGTLNALVNLVKTQSGMKNTLGFSYDHFSVVDHKELPKELISYDAATGVLKIPLVQEDGVVTPKTISYQFNGNYFERSR